MTDRPSPDELRAINALQRDYFNRYVDLFEPPLPEGVPERLRQIIRSGAIQTGESVLDVGTGTGILIPYIMEFEPSEVHACDLAEKMLTRVKDKFPHVITHLCDVGDLDLPEDSLDVVFINGCFSNIVDKAKSLDLLYRLLRPKGRLIISHPLGREFILELRKHAPFPLDLLPDDVEVRELLQQHGFNMTQYRDEPAFYLVHAESNKGLG
jgi:ubiquinone/menaquinone biosynthesis C-methylase UbiE